MKLVVGKKYKFRFHYCVVRMACRKTTRTRNSGCIPFACGPRACVWQHSAELGSLEGHLITEFLCTSVTWERCMGNGVCSYLELCFGWKTCIQHSSTTGLQRKFDTELVLWWVITGWDILIHSLLQKRDWTNWTIVEIELCNGTQGSRIDSTNMPGLLGMLSRSGMPSFMSSLPNRPNCWAARPAKGSQVLHKKYAQVT